jgi:hypothetical protein
MSPETAPETKHLSDEALDDLLIGAATRSHEAHLASCESCAARLATFRSSIALFNQASTAWSQARSNSISRELTPKSSAFRILPAWSIAAAFFLAVTLSFLVGMHRGLARRATAMDVAQQHIERRQHIDHQQQEIASDNAMLDAIDSEISQPVPSPVEVSGIQKAVAPVRRSLAPREVQD